MSLDLGIAWPQATLIAVDLETTGKYPLEAEICEMAAVKWKAGQIVATFQTLIRPTHKMSDEVIAIHNITNEMVETAPSLIDKIREFHAFVGDGVVIAHHAPFDMGFLCWEFERNQLALPEFPVCCTSLLTRAMVSAVSDHRLKTLAEHFSIDAGAAHRALDDAKTCLAVALKCFQTLGPTVTLAEIFKNQNRHLLWKDFSIDSLREKDILRLLVRATLDKREVHLNYQGGSRPGQARRVFPSGIVRNPDGDFLVATEGDEVQTKRYYLEKISGVRYVADGEF